MNRLLMAMGAVFLLLLGMDTCINRRTQSLRKASSGFKILTSQKEVPGHLISKIQITYPGQEKVWTFNKIEDIWRSGDYHKAYAQKGKLSSLVKGLWETGGGVIGKGKRDQIHYGLEESKVIKIKFFSDEGNPLLNVWVGREVRGQNLNEAYLKEENSSKVYHYNFNPRRTVGEEYKGTTAPLIDPYVFPKEVHPGNWDQINFSGWGGSRVRKLKRIEVEPEEKKGMPTMPGGSKMISMQGPSFEWFATVGGNKIKGERGVSEYLSYMKRLRYDSLLDSTPEQIEKIKKRGLVITFKNREGEKKNLFIGPRTSDRKTLLYNEFANLVMALSASKAAHLALTQTNVLAKSRDETPYLKVEPYVSFFQ